MATLYKHQLEAIEFHQSHPKFLLALEQGLGKTAIACSTITPQDHTLIICPATLKLNWERELKLFSFPHNIVVIKKSSDVLPIIPSTVIINYELLGRKKNKVISPNFDFSPFNRVILDESHYIKNPTAIRSLIATKICINTDKVLLLTGTPLERHRDLYMQMRALGIITSTFHEFGLEYCGAHIVKKFNRTIWDYDSSTNAPKLKSLISPFIFRKLKSEVLDLPEKIIKIIDLDLPIEQKFIPQQITEENIPEYFSNMASYLREEGIKKINQAVQHIQMRLESIRKIFVVARHLEVIDALKIQLKEFKPVKLDGRDSIVQKQFAIDQFQNNSDIRVFIGQIQAAGVGITLTQASHVIIVEADWSYSALMQVIDRCHRIGQKNKVIAEILTIAKSLDSIMINTVLNKKQNIERIL